MAEEKAKQLLTEITKTCGKECRECANRILKLISQEPQEKYYFFSYKVKAWGEIINIHSDASFLHPLEAVRHIHQKYINTSHLFEDKDTVELISWQPITREEYELWMELNK